MGARNIHRLWKRSLVDAEKLDLAAGDIMKVLPQVDNQGTFQFGDGTNDMDVKIMLGASTDFVLFDISAGRVEFDSAEVRFGDNDKLEFGDAADITMAWDNTDFDILQATANSKINLGISGAGIDLQLFGDTIGRDLIWDQSADTLLFGDSAKLGFGDGTDITIAWDGTDMDILQALANSSIKMGVSGAGIDLQMYGDTIGSDMLWDQSADSLIFGDNAKVVFGTGSDVTVTWDATTLNVTQALANSQIKFGVSGAGIDLQMFGDTVGADLIWDQSADSLIFGDNAKAVFGAGSDITVTWDNVTLNVTQALANSQIKFGVSGAGIDLQMFGDTIGSDLIWDQSADSLIFGDNAKAVFGTGSDITVAWDNVTLNVTQALANSQIKLGVSGAGIDVQMFGDTIGSDMIWDQSADSLIFGDNAKVVLGTGSDMSVAWDATKTVVTQALANSAIDLGVSGAGIDVNFYGDTVGRNAVWDQSADLFELKDSTRLSFGDGTDVTVTWDGTDMDILASLDDSLINLGNGTANFDLKTFGNIATSYSYWDASASLLDLVGPVRTAGFNNLGPRYELKWVAGSRGKPGINADIQDLTEAVRMIADPDFELLGLNAVSSTSAFAAGGGITLTTTAGSGDQVILVGHLDASQSVWGTTVTWPTSKSIVWEGLYTTGATITASTHWMGMKLTNTSVTATDDDQAFFRFQDTVNTGKFQAVYSIAGVDTATDSGVTVVLSTTYHLKIVVDSSRVARFYIDGVLVATSTALTSLTTLKPYMGVQTDTTAARAITLHGQALSRLY